MRSSLLPRYVEREHRVSVQCPCTLVESDGYEVEAQLVNLSRKGFGVYSTEELVTHETVYLKTYRSGAQRARLLWTRGRNAGGIFLEKAAAMS
jgi:hypothetical protein